MADTPFKRVKGLLGRKGLKPGTAMVIKPCNSIHTLFMRFPIGVLFVDKENRIIKVISALKPFRITPVYFKAHFTIELPAGILESTSTCQGDILSIEG